MITQGKSKVWSAALGLSAIVTLVTSLALNAADPVSASACTTKPDLAPDLAAWNRRSHLAAAASPEALGAARLVPGQAVDAQLMPTPQVHYLVRPEKPGGSVSHGGLFTFHIAATGRYRIALGSAAWIDVVRAGKPQISLAHGHGPDCSGIRKIVDFTLPAGDYTLQISANAGASTGVLVIPAT